MLYIGIDLGTSAVKLLLMDSEGNIRNIVSREYPLYFPHPGWSEQKPEDWYEQTMEGIRELLKRRGQEPGGRHQLRRTDAWTGHSGREGSGDPPAILWNDGRTTEECDYLNNVIGKGEAVGVHREYLLTGFTAPKILWVKKNEPENFRTDQKDHAAEGLHSVSLTGVHCTDVSDASGMLLFDVKNRCWSKGNV